MKRLGLFFIAALMLFVGLSANAQERQRRFDGKYYHDMPFPGWETETLERARMLAKVSWVPMQEMPRIGKPDVAFFEAGKEYSGIPYSGVSTTNGYIGRDASIYTYLSAIYNPKSVMYTTDYRTEERYLFRATYYGDVCSSSVMFAWQVPTIFNTVDIKDGLFPQVVLKKSQEFNDLQLCDAPFYYREGRGGHIMMVYDIARDAEGNIAKISIFESQAPCAKITEYTPDELFARYDKFQAPVYYYELDREHYGNILFVPDYMEKKLEDVQTDFPKNLCVNLGDKVSIAVGQDVTINILSRKFEKIELYKGEELVRTEKLDKGNDVVFSSLEVGLYKARLVDKKGNGSEYTCFEVGNTDFKVVKKDGKLHITCPDNTSVPQFFVIDYGPRIHLVPDRSTPGVWVYDGEIGTATHCCVHFAGKYGAYNGKNKPIVTE